ncbi:TPA: HTH domain-containing protein, partial [Candidatus Bathyarchaeota archaeon]|nr:HTH domain-containing protein [Candidatus Bathyarchaeota archaeon]
MHLRVKYLNANYIFFIGMVTYEELGKMKVIGPRPMQIKELLQEKPMSADEIAKTLEISVAAIRPY